MGRPPPPDEACDLACDLKARRYSLPRIQQELKAAGYTGCESLTTVSDWAERGAARREYIRLVEGRVEEFKGLDRDHERWVLACGIDQAMAITHDALTLAAHNPKVLGIALNALIRLLDMRAKITNAWAPPHAQPIDLGDQAAPVPPAWQTEIIRKTVEAKLQEVEQYRNGGQRET